MKRTLITLKQELTPALIEQAYSISQSREDIYFHFDHFDYGYEWLLKDVIDNPQKQAASYTKIFEGDFQPSEQIREIIALGLVKPIPLPTGEFKTSNLRCFALSITDLGKKYLEINKSILVNDFEEVLTLEQFLNTQYQNPQEISFRKKQKAIQEAIEGPPPWITSQQKNPSKKRHSLSGLETLLLGILIIMGVLLLIFIVFQRS